MANLATHAPVHTQLVKLQYFAGLSVDDAAKSLGISRATGSRHWHYAKAWLYYELHGQAESPGLSEKSPGS